MIDIIFNWSFVLGFVLGSLAGWWAALSWAMYVIDKAID